MNFFAKLERKTEIWFLITVSFLFFLLRLPSLFEPLWYGDEGIYQAIGLALNHGRLLYRDIWDNKPPLLYIFYAIFQSNQPVIRFVSLLFGIASVILFYFLAKKLFINKRVCYITTSIFAFLLAIPILEGNIANAENFTMPLILGAALLIANTMLTAKKPKHATKHNESLYLILNTKYLILFSGGFLLGLAFLFKVVAIVDLAAFTLFLLFMNSFHYRKVVVRLVPLYIGFLLPFICTVFYFALNHAVSDFIHSAFLTNVGYVNYGNQYIIPQGLLIFKLIFLAVFCVALFVKRNSLSPTTQFILIWLVFSIFNALFSQRPYTHYLLVLLSSFCLFIGLLLQKSKSQLLFAGVFLLIMLFFLTNFSFYKNNVGYYQNFITFLIGGKDVTSYRMFFDRATPRDYALADFLTNHLQKNDQLFIWGNNAQLYTLLNKIPPGKYIVAYHISTSKKTLRETAQALKKTHPKLIVIMPNVEKFPYGLTMYSQRLQIDNAIIYERSF